MKYYIATSLSKGRAHNSVRDALNLLGHEISYDWTVHGSVKEVSKERLREVSICELEGISGADFVVALLPGGHGTHFELGFALAHGKRVFLHSEDPLLFELGPQTNAFYHHPALTCFSCSLAELPQRIEDSIILDDSLDDCFLN